MQTKRVRCAALALALWGTLLPCASSAQESHAPARHQSVPAAGSAVFDALTLGSFDIVDATGKVLAAKRRGAGAAETIPVETLIELVRDGSPTDDHIVALWNVLADEDHARLVGLPLVKALADATRTPRTREALWSELSELAQAPRGNGNREARALLRMFEQHRAELLPLLPRMRESEGGGDEMARLMTSSRVFGDDIWQSLFDMVVRNPGAVARLIERERERGRPVKWEFQGFEGMMRWKDAHLVTGAPKAPRSLSALDAAGETFITIFNALHSLNDWYREQMLRGLGPVELFNAAVGGEQELYRLGTSGYRGFLHPIILRGIKQAGSFEAFLERATPHWLAEDGQATRSQRGMVFVRIASSFGLLDTVLETVRDHDRFIADAITALGDPRSFEGSSTIVIDVLTMPSGSPPTIAFKRSLLGRLYGLYGSEENAARRSVYGSMLSAYQAVTGDRRDEAIEREFPLDRSPMQVPYDRLFQHERGGEHVHRMFMRMHDDNDAKATYASFRTVMRSLGARVQDKPHYTVYRVAARRRAVEVYVNRPSEDGVRQGIADIAKLLGARHVQTIIGRGHTGIITPLQADSRRLLGGGIGRVAAVIVGSCGGDASVREMIGTFGYVPIVTTKSTGRQVINNAIVKDYIRTLLAMSPGETLSMASVVEKALSPFLRRRVEEEVQEDAKLYRVNLATVVAARLFDMHVRRHTQLQRHVAR